MELQGVLLCQPWGIRGWKGLAARLYAKERKWSLDCKIPYGEFILGGDKYHETYIVTKDEYLKDFVKRLSATELGNISFFNFGTEVPFNLKIISIRRPAPLMCNPNEEKGSLYHGRNVKCFPNPGVKSQLLIPLREFSLLAGFRSLDQIVEVLEEVPEMKYLIGIELIESFLKTKGEADFLKVFEKLLDTLPAKVESTGKLLLERLMKTEPSNIAAFLPVKLFQKLVRLYPFDVGIFLPCFLNVIKLRHLEPFCIGPGIPYAYLFGETIECSRSIENSAKAAFTCRRELNEFIDCLNVRFWSTEEIEDELFVPTRSLHHNVVEYLTMFPCFRVYTGIITNNFRQSLPKLSTFSIILIIEGEGKINGELSAKPGEAYLFYAEQSIKFAAIEKIFYVQVGVHYF